MAQTNSQTRDQWVAAGDPETVSTETTVKSRHRPKYGRTGHCRGNSGEKSPTEGSEGVPGTDTDTQTSTSSPSYAGRRPVPSWEKPWSLPYSMHDLRKKQLEDSDISPVLKWLESGSRPIGPEVAASSPATWHYWLYRGSLKITDGVLF